MSVNRIIRVFPFLSLKTISLLLLLVAFPLASHAEMIRARNARDRADKAIVEERWCDAMHDLIRVYRYSDRPDAIFNAGIAAEKANDIIIALSLFERFARLSPLSPQRPVAIERAEILKELINSGETGTSCPPPPPEPPLNEDIISDAHVLPEEVTETEMDSSYDTDSLPSIDDPETVALATFFGPDHLHYDSMPEAQIPLRYSSVNRKLRIAGWTLVGAGTGLFTTGGAFYRFAYNDKNFIESKSGYNHTFNVDMKKAEEDFLLNRRLGIGGISSGCVLTLTGIILLMISGDITY